MDDPTHPIHPYFVRLSKLLQSVQAGTIQNGITVKDLPTPSHLADLSRMLKNTDSMLQRASARGITMRPHIKTHKTIEGALLQLYGSSLPQITLQKFKETSKLVVSNLGEAKFFAEHGFCDILYAAPIVRSKLSRIEAILDGVDDRSDIHHPSLVQRLKEGEVQGVSPKPSSKASPKSLGVSIAVMIDSRFGFEVVKEKLRRDAAKRLSGENVPPLRLWLDVDGGYHRTGMNYEEDSEIDALLTEIANSVAVEGSEFSTPSHVLLSGLYYHGGNSYGSTSAAEIEKYAEREREAVHGMQLLCLSKGMKFAALAVGSTPTCSIPPQRDLEPINEFHPGNYIFYDSWQAMIGSCDWSSNASWVLAQVVSTYKHPDRVAFDAGALALSKDLGATHVRDALASVSSDSKPSSGVMASHPIVPIASPPEFGRVEGMEDKLYVSRITQEMGILQVRPGLQQPPLAHELMKQEDRFRIIPNHSCLSAACFPSLFIVSGDLVIDEWVTAPRIW